jgi:hypothetical protein
MTDQPWKCPDCATWMAPGVETHKCAAAEDPTEPPGYSSHMGGSFERSGRGNGWNPIGYGGMWP